jgi:hypothetical protein
VAEPLETAGHPLAVRGRLEHDPGGGRGPRAAAKRSGSVRIRCSINSPPSARIQI